MNEKIRKSTVIQKMVLALMLAGVLIMAGCHIENLEEEIDEQLYSKGRK